MAKIQQIQDKLRDERSGKVVFLSHCLLNTNARYLGGAFRSSCVNEIIQGAIERDIALVQMKCPEQQAWGGILKPFMWLAFESSGTFLYQLRAVLLPLFLFYTRLRYRRIARAAVTEICDYRKAGYIVVGIIGIDGSPSCGVNRKIVMKQAFDLYATGSVKELDREEFNRSLYARCLTGGSGVFIDEMKKGLGRRGMSIPFYSHSLLEEMDLKRDSIWEGIK